MHGPEMKSYNNSPLLDLPSSPTPKRYQLPPQITAATPPRSSPQPLQLPPDALSPEKSFTQDPGFAVHRKRFNEQTPPVKAATSATSKRVHTKIPRQVLERIFDESAEIVEHLISGEGNGANRTFTTSRSRPKPHYRPPSREPTERSYMDETLITTAVDEQREREMVDYSRLVRATQVKSRDVARTLHGNAPLPTEADVLWAALNQPKTQIDFEGEDEYKKRLSLL